MAAGGHELFTVLTGRCRVHHDDGSFQEAGPVVCNEPASVPHQHTVLQRCSAARRHGDAPLRGAGRHLGVAL